MANILVVEDNPAQAEHLSDLLLAGGHTVRICVSLLQTVVAVEQSVPALIITDLRLPAMDGLELVRMAREKFPATPVLVVTGNGSEELAVAALKAGAANYLPRRNLDRDLNSILDDLLTVAHSQIKRAVFLKRMAQVEYKFELENDPELIGNVVAQVELLMDQMDLFDSADRMQVGIGVHEAAVNAMIHGNLEIDSGLKRDNWDAYHEAVCTRAKLAPYQNRRVVVTLRATRSQELFIRITDEGPGFDISKLPDPTDVENLASGSGRGMLLIRTFFDTVRHSPKGNEITLIKQAR
jgi:CheY-like chemotaxis protein